MSRFLVVTLLLLGTACGFARLSVSGSLRVDESTVRDFDGTSMTTGPHAEAGDLSAHCERRGERLTLALSDRRSEPADDSAFEHFWLEAEEGTATRLDVQLDGRTYERLGECPVATSFSSWDDVVTFDCDVVDAEGAVVRFAGSLTLEGCLARE
ncbi:MAG: hypothetical protein H6721_04485 [Sandaracinus sp.]|nr:hypothetical protein [Myxococcales bacterium]MCB9616948.1 hypothetical protein [Sandaracinus sp.]MCB9620546.1 hypothetical protein [Sandaracinus sp.]MCB9631383.1 hypothetical protein [Sandaracinus sp.]